VSNRIIFFLFGLSFLLNSCEQSTSINEEIIVSVDFEKSKPTLLSDFAEEVSYVLLDQEDNFPIVNPYEVSIADSLILVNDRELGNLFIYGFDGRIRDIIKSNGFGPKEFSQIDEYAVFNSLIYILDESQRKTLVFDFEGNFKHEFKNEFSFINQFFGNDFKIYFSSDFTQYGYSFLRMGEDGSIQKYVPLDKEFIKPYFAHRNGFLFDHLNKQLLFTIPYSYKVAVFSEKGILNDLIHFDFGKNNFPKEEHKKFIFDQWNNKENFLKNKYVNFLNYFGNIQSGYLLSVSPGLGDSHWFFLDPSKKIFLQVRQKDIINDINGLPIKGSLVSSYSDHIVFMQNSNELFNEYQKLNQLEKTSHVDSQKFFDENLDKLVDDKFVLVFIKLKKLM